MPYPITEIDAIRKEFEEEGFCTVEGLLDEGEVSRYGDLYTRFMDGTFPVKPGMRGDLGGGHADRAVEKITQIMWPSDVLTLLHDTPAYSRLLGLMKALFGDEMEFDFDMLINKAPHTNTETPWHQDRAYWPKLPDTRACSCWIAIDESTLENGCMWYVPKSHLGPTLPHKTIGNNGALCCDPQTNGVYVPLKPGSVTLHGGGTLHYSRGNATEGSRRALILNFRPQKMIEMERAAGFDHGRSGNVVREVRTEAEAA